MKRRELERHLTAHGCEVPHEGANQIGKLPAPAARPQLKVSAQRQSAAGGRTCVSFRVTARGKAVKGALVRFAQQKRSTALNGCVRICKRLAPGLYRALVTRAGHKRAQLTVRIPRR